MLAVAVDHGEVRSRACQHSFYACRRKPAPADTLKAANARVLPSDLPDARRRSVTSNRRPQNRFPLDPLETCVEEPDDCCHIVAFIKRRHNDGQFYHLARDDWVDRQRGACCDFGLSFQHFSCIKLLQIVLSACKPRQIGSCRAVRPAWFITHARSKPLAVYECAELKKGNSMALRMWIPKSNQRG